MHTERKRWEVLLYIYVCTHFYDIFCTFYVHMCSAQCGVSACDSTVAPTKKQIAGFTQAVVRLCSKFPWARCRIV